MNKIKNKIIGRWKVEEVGYSIVTKKINIRASCVNCTNEYIFEIDKVNELNNVECNSCNGLDIEGKLGDTLNSKKVSLNRGTKKVIENEKDRYIIDKLDRLWKAIVKSNKVSICKEWKNDIGEFKRWSYSNGYKPWKVLDRFDKSLGYTPDNCYWRLDNKSIPNNLERILNDNTLSNSVRYIKDVSYNIEDIRMKLAIICVECNELLDSNHIINKGNIGDCVTNIKQCEIYLSKCSELIDKIRLMM